jgi:DNA-binding MarR family transcriptional regulator
VTEQQSLRDQLPSRWRPLFAVLGGFDAGIESVYAELGVVGVKPRFSMALMFLDLAGPMTIRRLATECGVSHSAMSQSVSGMRAAGLVESRPGTADARSRVVELTERGRAVVPLLRAEWDATEAAIAALEEELPYPPSQVAVDLAEALERRPFADRLSEQLSELLVEHRGEHLPEHPGEQLPRA